jgi:O-antigen ligase
LSTVLIRWTCDFLLWGILSSLAFFTPLTASPTGVTAVFCVRLAALVACLIFFLRSFVCDRALPRHRSLVPLILLACLSLPVLQMFLPKSSLPLLSGTVYTAATFHALWNLAAFAAIFWVTVHFFQNERQVSRFLRVIFLAGFSVSLLGILQSLSRTDKMFWTVEALDDTGAPFGFFATFYNPNVFSAFIGMVLLLLFGRLLYLQVRYGRGEAGRSHAADRLFTLFALVICSGALFLSLSRSGIVFFCLSLLVTYTWILVERKKNTRLMVLLFAIATISLLGWIGLESIFTELNTLLNLSKDASLNSRIEAWGIAVQHTFSSFPILGAGYGTFRHVFPLVQPVHSAGAWGHADNEWVQLFFETGFVGIGLAAALVFFYFRDVNRLRFDAFDPYLKYHGTGVIGALVFVLLMGLMENNLMITAVSIYAAFIAGLGLKLRDFQDEAAGVSRISVISLHGKFRRGLALTIAAGVFALVFAGILRPYLAWREAQKRGRDTVEHLERAVRLDPTNADYYFWLGMARGARAFYSKGQWNEELMREAIQSINHAIRLTPPRGFYYYGLATLYHQMGDQAQASVHYRKALEGERHNPHMYLFYSMFCLEQAVVESIVTGKELTEIEFFQKGFEAYREALRLKPGVRLEAYKQRFPYYERVASFMREKGLIAKDAVF